MKIYVTHYNPDLDSCMGIWLLTRYVYSNEDYKIQFVSVGEAITKDNGNYINVDTGGGLFDHHDTNKNVCASSLIMEYYGLDTDNAIKELVNYVLKIDHGYIFDTQVSDFHLLNVIEGLNNMSQKEPHHVVEIVLSSLDGIHNSLKQKIAAQKELENLITFKTKWGNGCAIETSNRKTRYLSHRKGYKVFLYVDPGNGYRGFTADGKSDVEFSDLYKKITECEPEADWFLHSSLQLLLCGSSKAPNKRKSKMSLSQMINLISIK